jgi:hypothetical protein
VRIRAKGWDPDPHIRMRLIDALHYTGHDALHYTGHDALHYTGHDAFQNSKASPYTLKVCIFVKFSAILKVHLRNIS